MVQRRVSENGTSSVCRQHIEHLEVININCAVTLG